MSCSLRVAKNFSYQFNQYVAVATLTLAVLILAPAAYRFATKLSQSRHKFWVCSNVCFIFLTRTIASATHFDTKRIMPRRLIEFCDSSPDVNVKGSLTNMNDFQSVGIFHST